MKNKSEKGNDLPISQAVENLLYELLETELGGVQVYEAALPAATNEELREEWTKYLQETRRHVEIARDLVVELGLDPDVDNPSREIVRMTGECLVRTISTARSKGDAGAAQLVACEAVVHAETKDHLNWELLSELAEQTTGDAREKIREACETVEEQEDRHLYHTKGWTRELWHQALGLPADLPPPEEKKDVTTAIGAERAKQGRRRLPRASSRGGRPVTTRKRRK